MFLKSGPDQMYVQPGLGGGAFNMTASTIIGIGMQECAVTTGLFNNDPRPDIVLLECGGMGVRVYLNMGGGNFSPPQNIPTRQGQSAPIAMVTTDFNLDGRVDLVVLNGSLGMTGHVTILLSNGNGTFLNPIVASVPADYTNLAVGDVDGDTLPDIVVGPSSNASSISMGVLINENGNALRPSQQFAGEMAHNAGLYSLALGDVTGDGKADIVYSANTSDVVVMRNQSQ